MKSVIKNTNIILLIFFSIVVLSLFNFCLSKENDYISNSTNYLTQQTSKNIYVKEGNESSTLGDGTESNPYESILYAIEKSSNGDTIVLLENIGYRQPAANVNFIINKNLTIDGQGNTLSFRGSNLEILANVEFKNLTLNMIPDGSSTTKIYASGNEVTFNNVSTLISQAQDSERPTIIGGSASGSPSGSHTKINIIGGSSETRFKEIIAGKENGDSSIPVTISISSVYSKVDNGINLGGVGNYKVTGKVNITTNSKNIKTINGTNSTNNTLTITDSTLYNINLINIQNLILKNKAEITPTTNFYGVKGNIELKEGTSLWINTPSQVELTNLLGTGALIISADTNILIKGKMEDASNIKINGFESDLYRNINKIFVEVSGSINQNTKVSLYQENEYYLIQKEDKKYRLLENLVFEKDYMIEINVIKKPNKLSYYIGEEIDLTGLELELVDDLYVTKIITHEELNDYDIIYEPNTKLTKDDNIITLKHDNIKATIEIEVTEKKSEPTDSEKYSPITKNITTTINNKVDAKSFITNSNELPASTTYTYVEEPDFSKEGNQDISINVLYPDNSKDIISVLLIIEKTQNTQDENIGKNDKLPEEEQKPVLDNNKEEIPKNEEVKDNEIKVPNENQNPQEEHPESDNIVDSENNTNTNDEDKKDTQNIEKNTTSKKNNKIIIIILSITSLLCVVITNYIGIREKKKNANLVKN